MGVCTYIIEGKPYSYEQLLNMILNSSEVAHDILYALDTNKQERNFSKLESIKQSNLRRTNNGSFIQDFADNTNILTGGAEIEVGNKDYSTQSFINSSLYIRRNGRPYIPAYNVDEYIAKKIEEDTAKVGEKQAKANGEFLKNNHKRIAKDSRDFHKIILRMHKNSTIKQTAELLKDTSFEDMEELFKLGTDDKESIYNSIYAKVFYKNGSVSKELNDNSAPRVLSNIKVSAQLLGRKSKIFGHIDFVSVKPDGSLEVFLIKCSHEPHSQWDRAKKEQYQHEMALLARILQNNGVNVNNIRFNVIPVVLKYDDQHRDITDVQVQDAICYSHNKGAFILQEAFTAASRFIESNMEEVQIESTSIDKINKQLAAFIPEGNVRAKGIDITINEFIDQNWHRWIQCEQPESGYNLLIDDTIYHVKSNEQKSKNSELVDLIKKEKLYKSEYLSAKGIITKLKDSRRVGFCDLDDPYLNDFFQKYFEYTVESINDKDYYNYKWSIVDNPDIVDCNIIMFQNSSGQVDVISLSELNLKKLNLYNTQKNILNYHLDDINARTNQGHKLLDATYGNIETMRLMFLVNELIPQLGNVKLGNVSVLGGLGTKPVSYTNPIQLVLPNFIKIRETLIKEDPTIQFENNFTNIEQISPVDLLIKSYHDIMEENPQLVNKEFNLYREIISGSDTDKMIHTTDGKVLDSLTTAKNTEVKIERLEELISKLQSYLKEKQGDISPEKLLQLRNSKSVNIRCCASLLVDALITLDRLQGNIRIIDEDLGGLTEYIDRPQNTTVSQIRLVSKLLQDAIHSTAYRLDKELSDFNNVCLEFYKEMGYTKLENFVLGSQARIFDNLFQNIEEDLYFKNPYDPAAQLNDAERKFLKKALFHINKIRFGETTIRSDKEMKALYNDYKHLWVPLEKASTSTASTKAWQDPIAYGKELSRRANKYLHDPKAYFQEQYSEILNPEEKTLVDRDIQDMQAYNKFRASETERGRERLMKNGKHFFETNIQNLVVDYTHKFIQEQEMNKMLIKTKGILLYLKIKGDEENDRENLNRYVKHIEDYLKVSVYNQSTMQPTSQKIEAVLRPIRKAVSAAYIMLNPIAAVRDTISGFRSNLIRSLTKFRTDIDPADVLWAYQYVLRKGSMSAMTIDLLDKFNAKYLISNINVESQQEGYKTNTEGFTTGNWTYATLRKPDFLNRMVLFMAKLKHDGSHEAYYIEDGQLKYNWRNDKRFNLLANKDTSNMDAYNKQKALYLSQIIAYNKENPSAHLEVSLNTDLPEGYTLNQIEEIKHLGNSIYGAYSTSEKAKYEHHIIGQQLAYFSTWMNGIWDVYFGQRRESSYETEKVQAEDEQGNKLYIDEQGNIVTTPTDTPYLVDIPLIVQGIMATYGDLFGIFLFRDNKLEALKQFWGSKVQRRNLLRSWSDLLYALLWKLLIQAALDALYEDHKKTSDGDNFAYNAFVEIIHKGYSSSFDDFMGPFPIVDYISNNTKAAAFQWQQKFIQDTYNLTFGDKTLGEYMIGMQALPRSMQDSYKMYQRDQKKGSEETKEE